MKQIFAIILLAATLSLSAQVGIGTVSPNPASILEISASDKGILLPRVALADVNNTIIDGVNTAPPGLMIYNTNAAIVGGSGVGYYVFDGTTWDRFAKTADISAGAVSSINAGQGLTGGGTGGTITINAGALNGLSSTANDIRLGGNLIQNTVISQNGRQMQFRLSGGSRFQVASFATPVFDVAVGGTTTVANNFLVRTGSTTGGIGTRLWNSANAGIIDIYRNNGIQHRILANGPTIFNSQRFGAADISMNGTAPYLFYADAGTNRIGIGTNTPISTLDVRGDMRITNIPNGGGSRMLTVTAGGYVRGALMPVADGRNGLIRTGNIIELGGGLYRNTLINMSGRLLDFQLSGGSRFRVLRGTAPTFEIDPGGNTNLANLLSIRTGSSVGAVQHRIPSIGVVNFNSLRNPFTDFHINGRFPNLFYADASTDRVGIGTAAPQFKLDVRGDIRTTGNIRRGGGVYNYPDYVFERYYDGFSEYNNTYQLISLSEIDLFLKENKHLPGVQSRADIATNGWIIDENVRTNLEKIEELFIHAIEGDIKIKRLTEENKTLKEQLESQQVEIDAIQKILKELRTTKE